MRAKVITTITTELDLDTMEPTHAVDVEDCDGLSEMSVDVLGALVIGALGAADRAAREQFPRAGRAAARLDDEDGDE
jgi:hypothetical protein